MALPVYSQRLWSLPSGWSQVSQPQSLPVPSGFVWVIREISATFGSGDIGAGAPLATLLVASLIVWTTPVVGGLAYQVYTASDVRFVMNAGEFMVFSAPSNAWQLSVSGYQLTAT